MKVLSEQGHVRFRQAHSIFVLWRLAIFLALCLCLGGTSLYVPTLKIPLYYVSVFFIGHAFINQNQSFQSLCRPSVVLGSTLIGLYALYIIPLPSSIWTALSGREIVLESFALTNNELPWLPLSLTPRLTFESIFSFLPIIAIASIMCLSAEENEINIAEKSIVFLAIISFIIGFIEIVSGIHIFTAYEFYTVGFPVGFFSNVNHQATLSAVALPLAIHFTLKQNIRNDSGSKLKLLFGATSSIILVLCLILTGSSTGYFFLILNLCLSLFVMLRGRKFSIFLIYPGIAVFVMLLVDFLFFQSHLLEIIEKVTSRSGTSRKQIFTTSIAAAKHFGVFGAGPGSFDMVYRIFENQNTVGGKYINEAHNEYIQIWMEFGLMGILWIIAAISWFLLKIKYLITSKATFISKHVIYALCILTFALISIVDFPLRTIAMSSILTFLVLRFDEFRPNSE